MITNDWSLLFLLTDTFVDILALPHEQDGYVDDQHMPIVDDFTAIVHRYVSCFDHDEH